MIRINEIHSTPVQVKNIKYKYYTRWYQGKVWLSGWMLMRNLRKPGKKRRVERYMSKCMSSQSD